MSDTRRSSELDGAARLVASARARVAAAAADLRLPDGDRLTEWQRRTMLAPVSALVPLATGTDVPAVPQVAAADRARFERALEGIPVAPSAADRPSGKTPGDRILSKMAADAPADPLDPEILGPIVIANMSGFLAILKDDAQ